MSGDNAGCTAIFTSGVGVKWSGGWQTFDVTDAFPSGGSIAVFSYGGVFHYVCGSYVVFNYSPPNSVPSLPLLTFPNGGEVIDQTALVNWNAAVDNETTQNNLTYDVDYSPDAGFTWLNVSQTSPGQTTLLWNTSGLPEGDSYRVRVRAFDGFDYGPFDSSGNNFSVRHFNAVFSNATQAGFAAAGSPVEWFVGATGVGNGSCNYTSLPSDRVNGLSVLNNTGSLVSFSSNGSWVEWNCDFSLSNYSVHYFTGALVFLEGAGSLVGGEWVKNYTLYGDAFRSVENVSLGILLDNFLAPGSDFARVLALNGSWVGLTPLLGEVDCDGPSPSYSSFIVDGLVWKVCKKDLDGNGVFEFYGLVVPSVGPGGVTLIQGGGFLSTSGSSGSGGSGGSNFSPTVIPSPSIIPTPTVLVEENVTLVESVEEINETGVILAPSVVEPGLVIIGFLTGGSIASGTVDLFDPDGSRFTREIGLDGSLSFYFDKEGVWKVRFGNETKEITVRKTVVATPFKKVLGEVEEVDKSTGLVSAGFNPVWLGVLFLLAAAGFLAWWFLRSKVRVAKSYSNGRVRVEVSSLVDLKDLVLTDVVPEELGVTGFSGASKRDTVTGAVLKWRKDVLKKGEKWVVEYGLNGTEGVVLKRAELKAVDSKEQKVVVLSNELVL